MGVTNSMVDVVTNGLFGVDPQLGPLTNNGGLGETHALTEDSPCIDVGSNPANMGYDQRGSGYLRTVGSASDIGAFEYQTPPSPPGFTGEPISINGGTGQRSMVNHVTINFSQIVNLPANPAAAFELKRQSDGATVGLVANVVNTAATKVTLTFTGAMTQGGSLLDGRYTLKMFATMISNGNGSLDGNGDGIGGDDYILASSGTNGVFRLFGDADGNGAVNAEDFVAFRNGYGLAGPSVFDADNNGVVSAFDFRQFRLRYGVTI
jgi:hypothetical protein